MTMYSIRPRAPVTNYSLLLAGSLGLSGSKAMQYLGSGSFPGPTIAALPTGVVWDTSYGGPSGTPNNMSLAFPTFNGTVRNASTVAEFNSAWNAAAAAGTNDIINVTADIVVTTPFILTARPSFPNQKILIRTSGHAGLPAYSSNYLTANKATNRLNIVTHAGSLRAFIIRANNCPAFRFQPACGGVWFQGLRIYSDTGFTQEGPLIEIVGRPSHVTEADMPYQIGITHCYLHSTGNNVKRALRADCDGLVVAHSVFKTAFQSNNDTQAIHWHGGGQNQVIFNNQLESPVENFLMGGAGITIPNFINNNIMMIRNEWSKDPSWSTSNLGKNVWEFKNGRRVLLWGNVVTSFFHGGQQHVIVLNNGLDTPNNPWIVVEDINMWCNKFFNIRGALFNIAMWGSSAHPVMGSRRIELAHNFDPGPRISGGVNRAQILGSATKGPSNDVRVHHNLMSHTSAAVWMDPKADTWIDSTGFVYSDNIERLSQTSGPLATSGGATNLTLLDAAYPGSYEIRNNWKKSGGAGWGTAANAPHNNRTFADDAEIFNNAALDDFSIKAGHPAQGSGLLGEDAGPNYTMLEAATAGVI